MKHHRRPCLHKRLVIPSECTEQTRTYACPIPALQTPISSVIVIGSTMALSEIVRTSIHTFITQGEIMGSHCGEVMFVGSQTLDAWNRNKLQSWSYVKEYAGASMSIQPYLGIRAEWSSILTVPWLSDRRACFCRCQKRDLTPQCPSYAKHQQTAVLGPCSSDSQ